MTSILIFVPSYGHQISSATFETTHALIPQLAARGIGGGIATFSYPEVSEARNIAITAWYDTVPASTHLLFVDSDMGFPPQLVLDLLLFNEPMVGALYSKKCLPTQWAASGLGGKTADARGQFMKVAGLGMGCFLIRRDAVTIMLEKMPELIDTDISLHAGKDMLPSGRIFRLFDPLIGPSGRMSEDLAFCHRWRECGGEVWAAIGHEVEHIGMYSYKANYMQMVAEKQAAGELEIPQAAE